LEKQNKSIFFNFVLASVYGSLDLNLKEISLKLKGKLNEAIDLALICLDENIFKCALASVFGSDEWPYN
jgi:hypothetical protein